MAEVKNMLHKVQHLFLSTSVSAQSYRSREEGDTVKESGGGERCSVRKNRSQGRRG